MFGGAAAGSTLLFKSDDLLFKSNYSSNYYYDSRNAQKKRKEKNGSKLLDAADENNFSRVKSLLKSGADLTIFYEENKFCALHCAANNKNYRMVKLLLKYGADPMLSQEEGHTPIQIAGRHDSAKILLLLINAAYDNKMKYQRHKPEMNLLDKANMLSTSTLLALAEFVANNYSTPKYNKYFKDIDIAALFEQVLAVVTRQETSYQRLCFQIGSFFLKQPELDDYLICAIKFLVLAGNYKIAKKLKEQAYSTLLGDSTEDDLHESPLINMLIDYLKSLSSKSASFNNELGEIYKLINDNERAYEYFKIAADLGSRTAVVHLAHFAKSMPDKRDELAKYKVMYYHRGLNGKKKNDAKALIYLERAIHADPDETLSYLTKHGKGFARTLLKDPEARKQIDVDFLIKLFTKHAIKCKLSKTDIIQFSIFCAYHNPTHPWVRRHPNITLFGIDKHLRIKLRTTFLILTLLNEDALPDKAVKYVHLLTKISKKELNKILDKFSISFDEEKIDRVRHIVEVYKNLLTMRHPSIESFALDIQGSYQLIKLIEESLEIQNPHRLEKMVQQAAVTEFKELLKNCEDEDKQEQIKQAIQHPLFKNHHTLFYPAYLLPTKSVRTLNKQLKEETRSLKHK